MRKRSSYVCLKRREFGAEIDDGGLHLDRLTPDRVPRELPVAVDGVDGALTVRPLARNLMPDPPACTDPIDLPRLRERGRRDIYRSATSSGRSAGARRRSVADPWVATRLYTLMSDRTAVTRWPGQSRACSAASFQIEFDVGFHPHRSHEALKTVAA